MCVDRSMGAARGFGLLYRMCGVYVVTHRSGVCRNVRVAYNLTCHGAYGGWGRGLQSVEWNRCLSAVNLWVVASVGAGDIVELLLEALLLGLKFIELSLRGLRRYFAGSRCISSLVCRCANRAYLVG